MVSLTENDCNGSLIGGLMWSRYFPLKPEGEIESDASTVASWEAVCLAKQTEAGVLAREIAFIHIDVLRLMVIPSKRNSFHTHRCPAFDSYNEHALKSFKEQFCGKRVKNRN